jgi:hypothetical protein
MNRYILLFVVCLSISLGIILVGTLGFYETCSASDVIPVLEQYPVLPPFWEYYGYIYDPCYDGGKTQSTFFLDQREIYEDCPGPELLNAGHHGGTHVVVQHRNTEGQWQWRPAVYPDRESMPQYPPTADAFSGCNFICDPELSGAYFVTYQRSDPNGAHAVFYLSPRQVQEPNEQPFDGHPLLTMRTIEGTPGDPICEGGIWALPAPFSLAGRSCVLIVSTGHRTDELPICIWSNYPVVFERNPATSWSNVSTNDYQHIWIWSDGQWILLRWNALELLGAGPEPGTNPSVQAQASVFQVKNSTYFLVVGGATLSSADWDEISRGFIFLYRFLEVPTPTLAKDYRVELVQTIVNPVGAMPGSATMVAGFIPGALTLLPVRLDANTPDVPSFVCGLKRRDVDDSNRWKYDFGNGPQNVSGGFVILKGSLAMDGRPTFEVVPPVPDTNGVSCDYLSGYGLCVLRGVNKDDVIVKVPTGKGSKVLQVFNEGGTFRLGDARILLDTEHIVPTENWTQYLFSACFLGLFKNGDSEGSYDLAVPFALQSTTDQEHIRHTYILRGGIKACDNSDDKSVVQPFAKADTTIK